MLKSVVNRREFIEITAGAGAALAMPTLGQAAVASSSKMIGIQVGAVSFVDEGTEKVLDVLFVIICGGIGLWSLRRFLFHSMRAEGLASQASCTDCGEYGRFTVVGDDRNPQETQVCCRKCAHLWTISQP